MQFTGKSDFWFIVVDCPFVFKTFDRADTRAEPPRSASKAAINSIRKDNLFGNKRLVGTINSE